MNAKEFDLISKDRIIHSALALGEDGKLESPYGAKTYGFPTVTRFYQDGLKIYDYFNKELLLEIAYDEVEELEFSVCSRLSGVKVVPYFIFYGRMIITRKDSRKFVIEFKLSELVQKIYDLLTEQNVRVTDYIGIVAATKEYDEERVYKLIEDNIKEWSAKYPIDNPQTDDFITKH